MRTGKLFCLLRGWSKGLTIAKKIGYGYSLAVAIAVLGTMLGLTVGDYYQRQAQEELTFRQNELSLLKELESAIWQVQFHPQQLAAVVGIPIEALKGSIKLAGEMGEWGDGEMMKQGAIFILFSLFYFTEILIPNS
ncbi:hypothetical protein [Dapis sp. BLCC M172]|uniref:hypothetical protein n=1 Tax=Dapis sp. BLCC M172 TaxID=2975281 RepID=UPI003CEC657A